MSKEQRNRGINVYIQSPWIIVLLDMITVAQLVKIFPPFTKTKISLPLSQEPVTDFYLSHRNAVHTLPPNLSKIQTNIILPYTPRSLPFRFPNQNVLCISHVSNACRCPMWD